MKVKANLKQRKPLLKKMKKTTPTNKFAHNNLYRKLN